MIVKLELSAEQIQWLDIFLGSPKNNATVLHWVPGVSGGYWVEAPSGEKLVELMDDGCRVNPDTGYYRVTLMVREKTTDPQDPDLRDRERPVLRKNFVHFLDQMLIFPVPPLSGEGGRIVGNVAPACHRLSAPLPSFARPKRAEPKGGTDEPATATDGEGAAPASEPTWDAIRAALIKSRGDSAQAADFLHVTPDVVRRAVEAHPSELLTFVPHS